MVGGDDFSTRPVRRGDDDQLAAAIEAAEPDVVIYAGSLSASSWDLPAADPTWRQEVDMAEGLTSAARRARRKLIALSSDVVFSGPKMFHDEAAATTSAHPAAAAVLQWEQTLLAGGGAGGANMCLCLGTGRRRAGARRADRPRLACRAAGAGRWTAFCHADFRGRSGTAVAASCRAQPDGALSFEWDRTGQHVPPGQWAGFAPGRTLLTHGRWPTLPPRRRELAARDLARQPACPASARSVATDAGRRAGAFCRGGARRRLPSALCGPIEQAA